MVIVVMLLFEVRERFWQGNKGKEMRGESMEN